MQIPGLWLLADVHACIHWNQLLAILHGNKELQRREPNCPLYRLSQ